VIEPFIHHERMAATAFEIVHQDQILGKLTFFDRMIFKGHLTMLQPRLAMKAFLDRQGVLLKDFGAYAKQLTDDLKARVQQVAAAAGAPYRYLGETHTKARGLSKEDLARQIAAQRGLVQGLVCVFSAVEPCSSFDVAGNRGTHRLEVVRRRRKCLHFYLYYLHPQLGLCHVRLQSWLPFTVQVWVNGREILTRALDAAGVGYVRHDNTFLKIDDWERAQKIANRLARKSWPRLLDRLVRPLNPALATIARAGFSGYYWVADQIEVATDVAFTTRPALAAVLPDLISHATSGFSSEDVLRFLGRKLHPALAAEVSTDTRRRPEGWRVKHRMERNSIKVYDKVSVLRVETTINNPAQFRVLRVKDGRHQWCPMRKGVANLPRFFQVGQGANERYLDALGQAQDTRAAKTALHRLCRPRTNRGHRHSRFNPVDQHDLALFRAALAGEHTINGFRNKDITQRLYPTSTTSRAEAKRRCARISRQIAKLRGHGLVAKIPKRRIYRVTPYGHQVMSAALAMHDRDFPAAYAAAA
jgi:hypothetical protein